MFLPCFLVFTALLCDSKISAQNLHCEERTDFSGIIRDSYSYGGDYGKCWKIQVPIGYYIRLTVNALILNSGNCQYGSLKLSFSGKNEIYNFCSSSENPVIGLSDVTVKFHVSNNYKYRYSYSFELLYNIESIICTQPDKFRCSKHFCIPRSKVCNGIKDCEDGADEVGCETGISGIKGVAKSRSNAISWLKGKRTKYWGWRENTHRAIIALYLADGANFNGTNKEEELMAKQLELKTSLALLRNETDPLLPNQLSMFMNSLLTVCLNPRKFYGFDLVKLLKDQLEGSQIIPIAYLSLCNANESMPEDAVFKLQNVLTASTKYPFMIDFQAMAVMALSCMKNQNMDLDKRNISVVQDYNATIKRFKSLQHEDGSFGNVHTTALVTQALLCSGQENSKDWELNTTIKYLMAQLNTSSVDFLTTYLTLPILNGKCLADIRKVNCSGNPRKHGEDEVDDIENKLGPKMRVQYSLYIGDDKDIIYTISLRVPENITAFEVMEIAAASDAKYKFKGKRISGVMYVYEIAGITNDAEDGKFWLMYKRAKSNSTAAFYYHYTESPDELIVQDQEYLIMWYKTVHI